MLLSPSDGRTYEQIQNLKESSSVHLFHQEEEIRKLRWENHTRPINQVSFQLI